MVQHSNMKHYKNIFAGQFGCDSTGQIFLFSHFSFGSSPSLHLSSHSFFLVFFFLSFFLSFVRSFFLSFFRSFVRSFFLLKKKRKEQIYQSIQARTPGKGQHKGEHDTAPGLSPSYEQNRISFLLSKTYHWTSFLLFFFASLTSSLHSRPARTLQATEWGKDSKR